LIVHILNSIDALPSTSLAWVTLNWHLVSCHIIKRMLLQQICTVRTYQLHSSFPLLNKRIDILNVTDKTKETYCQ
jgi:hypothetical protein